MTDRSEDAGGGGRRGRSLPVAGSAGAAAGEGEADGAACGDDVGEGDLDAEGLVDAAYESEDPAEQARLARAALALAPEHVDALLLLAGQAPSLEEALAAHAAARAAAERQLGVAPGGDLPDGADVDAPEARAWLRALQAEAELLAASGRPGEAAPGLARVAAHDPEDALAARSLLVACRLALGDDAGAAAVLGPPPATAPGREGKGKGKGKGNAADDDDEVAAEGEAAWRAWTRVLLALRAGPPGAAARAAVDAAFGAAWRANRHVPTYLLGRRRAPRDLAGRVVPGEPLEAARYALEHGAAWTATAGALAWLEAAAAAPPADDGPRPHVPPALRDRLRARPQDAGEVWQVGARRVPRWTVDPEGGRSRPWLAVVTGPAAPGGPGDAVLAVEPAVEPPSPAVLVDLLLTAMRRPREGASRRPARVEVARPDLAAALSTACAAVGVACVARAPLEPFTAVVDRKARALLPAQAEPGLVASGAPPARLAALVAAAADAYRAAPWALRGDDEVLALTVDGAARAAVVLGAAGDVFGLAVARDAAGLEAVRDAAAAAPAGGAPAPGAPPGEGGGAGCVVLLYDEPSRLPLHDLEALEGGAWPVAGEDAWPLVVGLDPARGGGPRLRAPRPDELDDLEAVARALAAGLLEGDAARAVAVRAGAPPGREVEVRLGG